MIMCRFRFVPAWIVISASLFLCSCSRQDAAPPASAESPPQKADKPAEKAAPEPVDVSAIAGRLHNGIDVSVHSGQIDWDKVAAQGHTFAYLKATEGMDLKDPAFDQHWQDLKRVGMARGAYHFYVTEDDPEIQAQFFIDNVHLEPGDLAPVVDVETLGHDTVMKGLADRVKIFVRALEKHYGIKPVIYTSPNFWDERMSNDFGEYPLWVAEYGVEEPHLPEGWSGWHLWQWQGDAEIPGVEKNADLSRINPNHPDLADIVVR